ncbi:MAG: hypothetical protein O2954_16935 [bacterium]|nr:hypothetical protein [bacterium]
MRTATPEPVVPATHRRVSPVEFAALAAVLATFFWFIQAASPNLIGVDAYFHIKYSQLLRTEGLIRELPWLSCTIYSQDFADDHFLFHVLQIPFTFGNLITGARLYATTVATLIFLYFYILLRAQNIRYPLAWTAALLVSAEPFLLRISMARASGVSLLFLLAATHIILTRKDLWIAPLAFFYVWLYGGFPLLGILVATVFGVSWIHEKQPRYRLLLGAVAGTLAGLICNPYFPHNIAFLFTSYTQIELGTFPEYVPAGTEDYPYAASSAVRNALPVWGLLFTILFLFLIRPWQLSSNALVLFLFSTILLCMYMNVRRFIEYWPPFAFLFAAHALEPYWGELFPQTLHRRVRYTAVAAVCIVLALAGWDTITEASLHRNEAVDYRPYEAASVYLKTNTAPHQRVFTASWSDFPLLFHFNTHNYYIVGMGLHYLYLYDPALYFLWQKIAQGKHPAPASAIRKQFDAEYVFSLESQHVFLQALERDPDAQLVFQQSGARIYRLAKSAP